MKPTDELKSEHDNILAMIKVMKSMISRKESGEEFNPDHIDKAVEFIRIYADQCHHGKEEDLLFPAMVEAGVPREGGPVGAMEYEHKIGRDCVKGMSEGVSELRAGTQGAGDKIYTNMQHYTQLLEDHIYKENNILFMIADMHILPEKQDELEEQFKIVANEKIGQDVITTQLNVLKELQGIYTKSKNFTG